MLALGLIIAVIAVTVEFIINLPDLIRQIGNYVKRFVFFLA